MMTRNSKTAPLKRAALLAAVATLAVTMSQPSMAAPAATTKAPAGVATKTGDSHVTDFSSRNRRVARRGGRHYGGNGGAAAAAAFAGIVGTAIIASQANRGYYNDGYYGGGPGYYGGGPRYYGGGPGYYRRGYGY